MLSLISTRENNVLAGTDDESHCNERCCSCEPLNRFDVCSIKNNMHGNAIALPKMSCAECENTSSIRPNDTLCQSLHRSTIRCKGVRRRRICLSIASKVVFSTLAVALAVILSPSLCLPSCEAFSPPSRVNTQQNFIQLNSSVRKRSGNHDVSVPKIEQHELQRKQSLFELQIKRQQQPRRSKNVFEQFTPEYIKSPFDIDALPKFPGSNGVSENVNDKVNDAVNSKQQKHLSQRLQSLLQNDEGEQDYFADDSPEAAQQVADIRIYGKLSEEARRKATEAVKEVKLKSSEGMGDSVELGGVEQLPPEATAQKKLKGKVRATVKETGSDSIGTYIKSLGQHELLNKADEVLLARQVRMLIALECTRKRLEKDQLR